MEPVLSRSRPVRRASASAAEPGGAPVPDGAGGRLARTPVGADAERRSPRGDGSADELRDHVQTQDGLRTQRISGAITHIYKDHYGKGPEGIRVHVSDDAVTAILRGGFTIVEESLRVSGRADAVREQRRVFGDLIATDLGAAVTEATGREIAAVLADTRQHPDITAIVAVFVSPENSGPDS